MSIKLEALMKALKIEINFSEEDRQKIKEMRESGRYGLESAKEAIYAGKILKRISQLVEKIDES